MKQNFIIADLQSLNLGTLGYFIPQIREFASKPSVSASICWLVGQDQQMEFGKTLVFGDAASSEQTVLCQNSQDVKTRVRELLSQLAREDILPPNGMAYVISFDPLIYGLAESWHDDVDPRIVPQKMADYRSAATLRPVDDRPRWESQISLGDAIDKIAIVMQQTKDVAGKEKWRVTDVITNLRPSLPELYTVNTQGFAQALVEEGVKRKVFKVNRKAGSDENWEFWLDGSGEASAPAIPVADPISPQTSSSSNAQDLPEKAKPRTFEKNFKDLGIGTSAVYRQLTFDILDRKLEKGITSRKFFNADIVTKRLLIISLDNDRAFSEHFSENPKLCADIEDEVPKALNGFKQQEIATKKAWITRVVCKSIVKLLFYSGSILDSDGNEVVWSDHFTAAGGTIDRNHESPLIYSIRSDHSVRCEAFLVATIVSFDKLSCYDDYQLEMAGTVFNDKSSQSIGKITELIGLCKEWGWIKEENGQLLAPNHPLTIAKEKENNSPLAIVE